jgi:hypothetical protein
MLTAKYRFKSALWRTVSAPGGSYRDIFDLEATEVTKLLAKWRINPSDTGILSDYLSTPAHPDFPQVKASAFYLRSKALFAYIPKPTAPSFTKIATLFSELFPLLHRNLSELPTDTTLGHSQRVDAEEFLKRAGTELQCTSDDFMRFTQDPFSRQ